MAGGFDACASNPLFAKLQGTLQKLALLEQDPVEASFQIHEAWEEPGWPRSIDLGRYEPI